MKLTFVMDNKTEDVRCNAEWGLSVLVESNGHKVLYDTGASKMCLENYVNLEKDPKEIEAIVFSHGHSDHTEGTKAFTDANKTAKLYIHKDGFFKSHGQDKNGDIETWWNCGIRWSDEYREEIKDRLVLTEGIVKLNDNMTIVGNIKPAPGFKPTERFVKVVNGEYVVDTMSHEQFLAVEEGDTIHILSGCGHMGVVSTILYAKELFPGKKIGSYTGGLHAYMLNEEKREELAAKMKELGVEKVVPMHCTGMNMIITLKERLGENCIIKCAGDELEL